VPGHELLDLSLAPAGGRVQKTVRALVRQVWCDQPHRREVEGAVAEHAQDAGMLPRRPRGQDPVIGLVLGEAQDLRAIGEERIEARGEMEIAGLELREMGHEADRRVTPGARQASQSFGQLVVRELGWSGDRHGPSYHGDFRGPWRRTAHENGMVACARVTRAPINGAGEPARAQRRTRAEARIHMRPRPKPVKTFLAVLKDFAIDAFSR